MKRYLNKKKLAIYFVIVAIMIAGIVYAIFHFGGGKDKHTRLVEVTKKDFIQKVSVSGKITPFRQTIITAPYTGYVKKIYVKVGQKVKAGDPLVSVVESLQAEQKVFPIRAPYDGTVVLVNKSEGAFVKKDDDKDFILKVDDLHELHVNADVPEVDIPKVKVGQEAIIKATPILDKTYKGVVRTISLSPEQANQDYWSSQGQARYPVDILIIGDKAGLNTGMSTIADIVIAEEKDVMVLPHEFVQKEDDKYFVTTDYGKKKPVIIGLQNARDVVIKSGITVGEKVMQIDYFDGSKSDK